jgi:lysozyme
MKDQLINILKKHEGERFQVYDCPAGYPTIGVGRNLETKGLTKEECDYLKLGVYERNSVIAKLEVRGITQEESDYLLSNDIDYVTNQLSKRLFRFNSLPEQAKIVLIDMAFNLGVDGLLKFNKTLSLINSGKYKEASKEMLNSKWAKQVGNRAYELSAMLTKCLLNT